MALLAQAYPASTQSHGHYVVGCRIAHLQASHPPSRDFKGVKHRGAQGIAAETIAKMRLHRGDPGGDAYSALEKRA